MRALDRHLTLPMPSVPMFPERHGCAVDDTPPIAPERGRLLVVVPFRDRAAHLAELLPVLRRALAAQAIDSDIVVVEQAPGRPFNRGMLLNIGAAHGGARCDYYCFHDVDLVPEAADYRMRAHPTHLSPFVSHLNYSPPYREIFGGVTLLGRDDFVAVNGYSNGYWGWGAEDDDLLLRVLARGLVPLRVAGRYRSLPHVPAGSHTGQVSAETQRNRERLAGFARGDGRERLGGEGLDSLRFELLSEVREPRFARLVVEI